MRADLNHERHGDYSPADMALYLYASMGKRSEAMQESPRSMRRFSNKPKIK